MRPPRCSMVIRGTSVTTTYDIKSSDDLSKFCGGLGVPALILFSGVSRIRNFWITRYALLSREFWETTQSVWPWWGHNYDFGSGKFTCANNKFGSLRNGDWVRVFGVLQPTSWVEWGSGQRCSRPRHDQRTLDSAQP